MKKQLLNLLYLLSVCLIAGLVFYAVLSRIVAIPRQVPKPIAAARAPAPPVAVTVPDAGRTVGWLFDISASAKDDPEQSRSFGTQVEFRGTVESCPQSGSGVYQELGLDKIGGMASASKAVSVCVPGCAGLPPSEAVSALPRRLALTAFQEEFDRAAGDYAPEGQVAEVQFQCNGREVRLVAAAVVALACNSDSCGDRQVSNAAVYLAVEQGHSLDKADVVFPLQSIAGYGLIGSSFDSSGGVLKSITTP